MFLFAAQFPPSYGLNFSRSSKQLRIFMVPSAFNADLTKSRLNDGLYLCETLTGTLTGSASNGGLGGFVVLDFV
jgi:hypothetical protein